MTNKLSKTQETKQGDGEHLSLPSSLVYSIKTDALLTNPMNNQDNEETLTTETKRLIEKWKKEKPLT